MFSKFHSSDLEKQDRILNAALKEFAEKGYKNASTNQIVKDAGISKGLLFHYFNNKKDLYLFLYDHFIEIFVEQIKERVDWDEKDIFITILAHDLRGPFNYFLGFSAGAVIQESFGQTGGLSFGQEQEGPDDGIGPVEGILSIRGKSSDG